jgi:hypothetical protein
MLLLLVLDLLGIAVFAISGGLVAVRQRLDIVGVLVLATVTGLGGGLIRDVLAGQVPVVLKSGGRPSLPGPDPCRALTSVPWFRGSLRSHLNQRRGHSGRL